MTLITCHAVLVQMYVSANVRAQRHAHCYRYTKHQQNNDAWVVLINRASRWPALGCSITSMTFVTLSLIMEANELTSSIAISDRKLHAGMVDQDPTGP